MANGHKRIFGWGLRFGIVLTSVAGLVGLAMWWGPTRGVLLYAVGRTSTCTLERAVRSPKETTAQMAAYRRVSKTSRLVRKEEASGLELWQTEQGPFWIVSDNEMHWFFLFLAEQDSDIYNSPEAGVRFGDIVLDCGAHYGLFTRRALRAGAKLAVAIEPAPPNLECFRRNLSKEIAEGRVVVYPKGVWDKDDYLTLNIDHRESGADSFVVRREGTTPMAKVPLTTIDKLVTELNLPRVDFVKMDIEGAERQAMAGARNTLVKYRPRMSIAVYHLPDDGVVIPKIVRGIEPRYRNACGICTDWALHMRQEVAHFY